MLDLAQYPVFPWVIADYDSATDIELLPGFEVYLGSELDAYIDGCNEVLREHSENNKSINDVIIPHNQLDENLKKSNN